MMKRTIVGVLFSLILFLLTGVFLANSQTSPPRTLTYFIPRPDARNVNPAISLAIREGSLLDSSTISPDLFMVTGNRSGLHTRPG